MQAQSDMNNIAARIEQQNPITNEGLGVNVISLHDYVSGDYREGLLILLGVVGCVLLVACVNVANLMIARGTARQREFAMAWSNPGLTVKKPSGVRLPVRN